MAVLGDGNLFNTLQMLGQASRSCRLGLGIIFVQENWARRKNTVGECDGLLIKTNYERLDAPQIKSVFFHLAFTVDNMLNGNFSQ